MIPARAPAAGRIPPAGRDWPDDLAALLAPAGTAGLTDPDDVPAPPDAATTSPGETRKSTGRSCGIIVSRSARIWSGWTVVRIGVDSRTFPLSRPVRIARFTGSPPSIRCKVA